MTSEIEAAASWPEWLVGWLKQPWYGEVKCGRHEMHYNTLYCVTCKDEPMCDECWKKSQLHKGDHHQTLQVLRSSRRVAIEVKDIRKFVDISEIQVYSINSKSILYLNPNKASSSLAKHDPYCHTCRRKLIKSDYKFCSIFCKVDNKVPDMAIEKKCESERSSRSSDIDFLVNYDELIREREEILLMKRNIEQCNSNSNSSSSSLFSFRKRSRKGIPRRAPLQ